MAWRSSGSTNDEMVDKLKRYGVIQSDHVERGFRNVDRRFFVAPMHRDLAHRDRPLQEGHIHLSAPHIYGSVCEALELQPGRSFSFLNLGSGTGYLTCIVADILGPTSACYGVEIHADVVEHCKEATALWRASQSHKSVCHMEFVQGNALHVDATKGESRVGYDRIYIGAACEKRHLSALAHLLRPGGILVGPVDDELVKVMRCSGEESVAQVPQLPRSFRGQAPALPRNFLQTVISPVRFAPLLPTPQTKTVIESRIWEPSIHKFYPPAFQHSCKAILLCSQASSIQVRPPVKVIHSVNAASMLPRALWMEILSFAHRDWFDQPPSEEEYLRQRLVEEKAAAEEARQAHKELEIRMRGMERERDVYRLLAARWKSRLSAVLRDRNGEDLDLGDEPEDVRQMASELVANQPFLVSRNVMRRTFQGDSDGESEEEDEDHDYAPMEEDTESEDNDASVEEESGGDFMSLSPSAAPARAGRSQIRTVSISEDL